MFWKGQILWPVGWVLFGKACRPAPGREDNRGSPTSFHRARAAAAIRTQFSLHAPRNPQRLRDRRIAQPIIHPAIGSDPSS
jgi:hypothetical protein